jgi:hypothetical protein
VVDHETVRVSEERRSFHVRCVYRRPTRSGNTLSEEWKEEIVAFADLVWDVDGQRVYYFDHAAEEVRLQQSVASELRAQFLDF